MSPPMSRFCVLNVRWSTGPGGALVPAPRESTETPPLTAALRSRQPSEPASHTLDFPDVGPCSASRNAQPNHAR